MVGRWGSHVVQQYTSDAAVGPEAAIARRRLFSGSLGQLAARDASALSVEELRHLASVEVTEALQKWTPEVSETIKASLLPDLVREVGRRQAAARASSASSSSSSSSAASRLEPRAPPQPPSPHIDPTAFAADLNVTSMSTRPRRHKVLVGPSLTLCQTSSITWCGWRWGAAGSTRDPQPADKICRKCFPSPRGAELGIQQPP